MVKDTAVPMDKSIATQLLGKVFGIYFLVALVVRTVRRIQGNLNMSSSSMEKIRSTRFSIIAGEDFLYLVSNRLVS